MKRILLIATGFSFLLGCGHPKQNSINQKNDLTRNEKTTTSKDTLPTLSSRIRASGEKHDSIQNYLVDRYWKTYRPDSISGFTWEYTYKEQKKTWNSTNIILKGYIEDIVALDNSKSQLIIRDLFSHRYFIVDMTIAQADTILKIDDNHVFAFLLVKDLVFNIQIINQVSGWSGTADNDIDIDYEKKYELITRCKLIDIVIDE